MTGTKDIKSEFAILAAEARACTVCAEHLPLGPRPTFQASPSARLLIAGQAPGTKVHESGIPWNDRSGDRLRQWLELDREIFYDDSRVALIPTGLCYPGIDAHGGDLPPRPECAPLWMNRFIAALPRIKLTLLVGNYAQRFFLGRRAGITMTETVRGFREMGPRFLALPHPSWRTTGWERKNPWFTEELLPELRSRVAKTLRSRL